MKTSFLISDDEFISPEMQSHIENVFLNSGSFPWLLNLRTNDYLDKNNDTFQFTHPFFMDEEICSEYYPVAINLFNSFLNKHGLSCSKLIRAKANLTTKNNELECQEPHIDTDIEHKVFLYYINDSDGDTIFYKDDVDLSSPVKEKQNLLIDKRVSPLKGRAVVFDGMTYHSASNPKINNLRAVINIAYIE